MIHDPFFWPDTRTKGWPIPHLYTVFAYLYLVKSLHDALMHTVYTYIPTYIYLHKQTHTHIFIYIFIYDQPISTGSCAGDPLRPPAALHSRTHTCGRPLIGAALCGARGQLGADVQVCLCLG